MISTDTAFIVPFLIWLKENPLTVAAFIFALGMVAKLTPWVGDDKIVTFIKGLLQVVTPGTGITANNISEKMKEKWEKESIS